MAVKKSTPLADTLDAIARAAPGLRANGVMKVTVGEVTVQLAPALPADTKEPKAPPDVSLGDLDDAFGKDRRLREEEPS